jgi:hypothetical protein
MVPTHRINKFFNPLFLSGLSELFWKDFERCYGQFSSRMNLWHVTNTFYLLTSHYKERCMIYRAWNCTLNSTGWAVFEWIASAIDDSYEYLLRYMHRFTIDRSKLTWFLNLTSCIGYLAEINITYLAGDYYNCDNSTIFMIFPVKHFPGSK